MKDKYWFNHLLGGVLAFLFAFCAVGCLQTGWALNLKSPNLLVLWCGIFAVLMPLLLYFRHGIWVLLLLLIRGAFALWQDGELWNQIKTLAHVISSHFRDVYRWPVIGEECSESFDLVLILLACLTALCVSCCICRNKHSGMALIPVLLPLTLCLITTDTLPDELILAPLILGAALMLLTDWVRRNQPERFAGLFLRMLIPASAALVLLFGLNPQEEYVNRAAELQKTAVTLYEKVKSAAESIMSGNLTGSPALETVNLRNVGPKSDFSFTVMRVTSPYDGVVYLRGRDYDTYTGTVWESSEGRSEVFPTGTMTGSDGKGTMRVVTYGIRNVRYTPYYPAESITLTDGFLENNGNVEAYTYSVSRMPDAYSGSVIDESDYTNLPRETRDWARKLTKEILGGRRTAGVREIANRIGDYVKNSASYDLNTPVMSDDYEDFAQWFLEAGDTGYCVHFATAATVLLRTEGIPARYVEGYMIPCRAGERMLVSNQSAHAWVEYYDSEDMVWRILEATPAAALVPTPSITDETEEETAEPEETEETEETESEETEPEDTEPDKNHAPDEPDEDGGSETSSETVRQPNQSSGNTGSSQNGGSGSGNNTGTGEQSGTGSGAEKEPFVMPGWVKKLGRILLYALLITAAVMSQAYLRMAHRRKRWYGGTPNEMALERRKQLLFMGRPVGLTLPSELEELALKAKFSQHTLTRQELYRFELFRRQIFEIVDSLPWYRRMILRWILAVG